MIKIKIWITRNKDISEQTYLWIREPKMDESRGIYRCLDGYANSILLSSYYGLRPGEIKEGELIVR